MVQDDREERSHSLQFAGQFRLLLCRQTTLLGEGLVLLAGALALGLQFSLQLGAILLPGSLLLAGRLQNLRELLIVARGRLTRRQLGRDARQSLQVLLDVFLKLARLGSVPFDTLAHRDELRADLTYFRLRLAKVHVFLEKLLVGGGDLGPNPLRLRVGGADFRP